MISEDYVSFEVAKLLKEKGFDAYGDGSYDSGIEIYKEYSPVGKLNSCATSKPSKKAYPAPTLQMAMKWLREEHNLFIQITIIPHTTVTVEQNYYMFAVCKDRRNLVFRSDHPHDNYSTYEEACEAAIKYCLKNLIKNEDEEEKSDIPVPKTVDEAISTLVKILSDEDREYLLENGAISMHDSLGRWIRNEWGLWTGSELKNELKKKGFEHPDDMSNYIIEEFIKYWNNKL